MFRWVSKEPNILHQFFMMRLSSTGTRVPWILHEKLKHGSLQDFGGNASPVDGFESCYTLEIEMSLHSCMSNKAYIYVEVVQQLFNLRVDGANSLDKDGG